MFRVFVETKQYTTEDPNKIAIALTSILSGEVKKKEIGEDVYFFVENKNYSALNNLHALFRQQRILDVARKALRDGIVGKATIFYLNKQVAYVKKINFCNQEGESPLGPIRVEIEYEDIDKLIDWLAPYTKEGMEVKLVNTFP